MAIYRTYKGRSRFDTVDYLNAEDAWKAIHAWYDKITADVDEFEYSLSEVDEVSEILDDLENNLTEAGIIYILEPSVYIGEDMQRTAVSVRKVG